MGTTPINLLLADDDPDDCLLFKDALEELPVDAKLTTVNDGVCLMKLLNKKEHELPYALYLDLNMPLKDGMECLTEIKQNKSLHQLPVIIFSTSYIPHVINQLYENGAQYYICKPGAFDNLKKIILKSITLISVTGQHQPARDKFILSPS